MDIFFVGRKKRMPIIAQGTSCDQNHLRIHRAFRLLCIKESGWLWSTSGQNERCEVLRENGTGLAFRGSMIMARGKQKKNPIGLNPELAAEAKAIVALAFRNGPIEDVHAGKPCPTCSGDASYSRISDPEMKIIMKNAVDRVYSLLWMKQNNPIAYASNLALGRVYSTTWDDPVLRLQTGQG